MTALMPALSTPAATRNAWTCPTCRHGSPDPRDELAHLDAHRQLGQFLKEWDAAVESDRKKGRGRRPVIVALVGLLVVAVVVAGTVFLGVGRAGRSSGHVAGPVPGSIVPTPPPRPQPARAPGPTPTPPPPEAPVPAQVTPQVPPADVAPSAPQSPAIVSATPAAAAASSAPPADAPVTAVPAPPTPAPASTTTLVSLRAGPPAPAPANLLEVCLLGSCLTIP